MRTMLLVLLAAVIPAAELRFASLFAPGAVLQREQTLPVWGSATPGAVVRVTCADQERTATTGPDGAWRVDFAPLHRSDGAQELTAWVENDRITCGDLLVGDVWLQSGQSNMAIELRWIRRNAPATASDLALVAADLPQVHWFRVANTLRAPAPAGWNTWVAQSATVADGCSLVGLHFARSLYQASGVPVGIILAAQGGSPAEAWLPREQVLAMSHGPGFLSTAERIAGKNPGNPGFHPPSNLPGALYATMIQPLFPAALRGVCWYQGESNVGQVQAYPAVMRALIADWRRGFGRSELPFVLVQLPNLSPNPAFRDDPERWPWMRETQAHIARAVPGCTLVVSHDGVPTNDLHPWDKRRIGERLALAAQGRLNVVTAQEIRPEGAGMLVVFPVGSTLATRDGAALRGFTVAGADGIWHPAEARLDGANVRVHSLAVPSPRHLRYAWSASADATLIAGDGLPIGCFRSDDLPPGQ